MTPLACEIQHRHQHGAFGIKTTPGDSFTFQGAARTWGRAHPAGQPLAGQIKSYRTEARKKQESRRPDSTGVRGFGLYP